MDFVKIKTENFEELTKLQKAYKVEIGECMPTNAELESLRNAIENEQIHFYGCICDKSLIACCSICFMYSTFNYGKSGVFEDFYIQPTTSQYLFVDRRINARCYHNRSRLSVGRRKGVVEGVYREEQYSTCTHVEYAFTL